MYFSFFWIFRHINLIHLTLQKSPMGDFGGFYLTRNVFKSATLKSLPRTAKPQSVDRNIKALIETSKRRQTFERFFKRNTSTPARNVFKSSTLKSCHAQQNRKASIETQSVIETSKRRQTFERFFGRKTSTLKETFSSLRRWKVYHAQQNLKASIET